MNVLVVGGYFDDPDHPIFSLYQTKQEFQEACREIGKLIAEAGANLLIQHDDPKYADQYIVEGYATAVGSVSKASIFVMLPQSASFRPFEDVAKKIPGLISFELTNCHTWRAARIAFAASAADIVIAIGGTVGTEFTAYAALAAGTQVIPVACFGGAAEKLLPVIMNGEIAETSLPEWVSKKTLNGVWSHRVSETIARCISSSPPVIVVVHGSDEPNRQCLLGILEGPECGLPQSSIIVMGLTETFGSTLPSKWSQLASTADATIVLATPDDIGYARSEGNEHEQFRARQNVWLELGWFWGRYADLKRVLLLLKTDPLEPIDVPTDLHGLEHFPWGKSVEEAKDTIIHFVEHVSGVPRRSRVIRSDRVALRPLR